MKKIVMILLGALTLSEIKVSAQNPFGRKDDNNLNLSEAKTEIEGSPFLFDGWQTGTVITATGKKYNNVLLNYDIRADILFFMDANKQQLAFTEPLMMFTANNNVYMCGFLPVDRQTAKTFYQVLANGKVKLLKLSTKSVKERQEYDGTQRIDRLYQLRELYYINKNDKMYRVSPDKKSIMKVLSEHNEQMEAYLKDHPLNSRDDASLGQLVAYYNTF